MNVRSSTSGPPSSAQPLPSAAPTRPAPLTRRERGDFQRACATLNARLDRADPLGRAPARPADPDDIASAFDLVRQVDHQRLTAYLGEHLVATLFARACEALMHTAHHNPWNAPLPVVEAFSTVQALLGDVRGPLCKHPIAQRALSDSLPFLLTQLGSTDLPLSATEVVGVFLGVRRVLINRALLSELPHAAPQRLQWALDDALPCMLQRLSPPLLAGLPSEAVQELIVTVQMLLDERHAGAFCTRDFHCALEVSLENLLHRAGQTERSLTGPAEVSTAFRFLARIARSGFMACPDIERALRAVRNALVERFDRADWARCDFACLRILSLGLLELRESRWLLGVDFTRMLNAIERRMPPPPDSPWPHPHRVALTGLQLTLLDTGATVCAPQAMRLLLARLADGLPDQLAWLERIQAPAAQDIEALCATAMLCRLVLQWPASMPDAVPGEAGSGVAALEPVLQRLADLAQQDWDAVCHTKAQNRALARFCIEVMHLRYRGPDDQAPRAAGGAPVPLSPERAALDTVGLKTPEHDPMDLIDLNQAVHDPALTAARPAHRAQTAGSAYPAAWTA